jgi:hypothetical protein
VRTLNKPIPQLINAIQSKSQIHQNFNPLKSSSNKIIDPHFSNFFSGILNKLEKAKNREKIKIKVLLFCTTSIKVL